uniref:RING-type domain-containing protein n=1 Tax=Erpetoichthys calabaricus TaxID=27687 RepID=A0A8C4X5J4_ERPCA
MGYDIERIVGYVNEGLCICQDVLENPLQSPCEHAFCSTCIHGWLVHHHNCPEDRQSLNVSVLRPLFRYMKNDLNQLQIRCRNREHGCNMVCSLESIDLHEWTCINAHIGATAVMEDEQELQKDKVIVVQNIQKNLQKDKYMVLQYLQRELQMEKDTAIQNFQKEKNTTIQNIQKEKDTEKYMELQNLQRELQKEKNTELQNLHRKLQKEKDTAIQNLQKEKHTAIQNLQKEKHGAPKPPKGTTKGKIYGAPKPPKRTAKGKNTELQNLHRKLQKEKDQCPYRSHCSHGRRRATE